MVLTLLIRYFKSSTVVLRVCTLFASLLASWTSAQPFDPSSELQRQDRQRQELRQRMEVQPWVPSDTTHLAQPQQQLPEEQPCALISQVVIQGILFSESLQTALGGVQESDPPQGRCLGSQGITLLIQRVQQTLVEQGYITSHVYVPEQDLRSGVLLLKISEGRIARIRQMPENGAMLRGAWAVQEGKILNLRDIEQSSDNLQRLPSLFSKIQVEPGEAPGTSDLVVELQAKRPWRLGLSIDDSGNKTTGKLQGDLTLSWDNLLDLSDLAYITLGQDLGNKDNGPRGSQSQIMHYSVPWGYWLLGTTWSQNHYRQTVYGPYESYLYRGVSSQKELSLQRVLQRAGHSKTTASLKGFVRQSNNHIEDLEVLVQRRRTAGWEAGVQHLHYLETGTLTAQLALRRGTGALSAIPAPEEATGQGTGRMRLVTGLLHWAMPLNTENHSWQYSTQLQWQWSHTRLTPQDQFCIGGRSTVRGFNGQQTLCGDQGQLWRQELVTTLPAFIPMTSDVRAYAALDTGRTATPGQEAAYRSLTGMALGLRGQHMLTNNAYPLQWDVFVGCPLFHPQGFTTARYTAGMSLRAEF